MRTTLTLDDDLAATLKARARERGVAFKVVLNEALRAGLPEGSRRPRPYRVPTLPLRARGELNLDKALRLAGELEDREILREAARGK